MPRPRRATLAICLCLCLWPTAASAVSGPPVVVRLGIHRFGHLSRPEAIVARAGPRAVGSGASGAANGPWSYDVAADGTVWVLDPLDRRLLMWAPGAPGRIERTLPVPDQVGSTGDLALGPDGTIYLSYVPAHPSGGPQQLEVLALDPRGHVRWTTETDMANVDTVLRMGPNGILYWAPGLGTGGWTALTGPSGRPLSLADQRRSTLPAQPLGDGRFLDEVGVSQHETRVSLLDETSAVVTWWSVTSATRTYADGATPALVGGDPVVPLIVQAAPGPDGKTEYLVVRLAEDGTTPVRLSLPVDTAIDGSPVTPPQVGADGSLYQLSSGAGSGVSIARYSLGTSSTVTPAPTSTPTPDTSDPSTAGSPTRAWATIGLVLVGLVLLLVRRRAGSGRHRIR